MKIRRVVRIKRYKDAEVKEYCCSLMKGRLQDGSSLFLVKWGGAFISSLYSLNIPGLPYSQMKFCPFYGKKVEICKEIKEGE